MNLQALRTDKNTINVSLLIKNGLTTLFLSGSFSLSLDLNLDLDLDQCHSIIREDPIRSTHKKFIN